EAGRSGADLRRGDGAILPPRIAQHLQDGARQLAPLGGALLDGRARHADQGEFRRHEERVEEDEQKDDQGDGHSPSTSSSSGAFGRTRTERTVLGLVRSTVTSTPPISSVSPSAGIRPKASRTW